MLAQEAFDQRLVGNVSMNESIARMAVQILRIGPIPGISEGVKVDHVMAALNDQAADEMRTYEPGTAGDENIHVCVPTQLAERYAISVDALDLAARFTTGESCVVPEHQTSIEPVRVYALYNTRTRKSRDKEGVG
jgi:hypothetical protein